MTSKRRRRRLRGRLRAAVRDGLASGPVEPFDIAEIKESARKRYSLDELLTGAHAMKRLNATVAWARDGEPAGNERA